MSEPLVLPQEQALSSEPILAAIERYQGTIVDIDFPARTLLPDTLARGRKSLENSLRRQGLKAGERVIIAIPNGALFVATFAAVLACDASPLLVHFKTPPAELHRYAKRYGIRFIATVLEDPSELPSYTAIETSAVTLPFVTGQMLHWGLLDVAEQSFVGPVLKGVPLHPTSGSTGLPKIALRPGYAAVEEARHYVETMAIDQHDSIVAIPPMSHAYGYGMCLMVPLITGANIISTSKFSGAAIKAAIEDHAATILPMVPAMLDLLMFGSKLDWRSTRWLLTAGSMLTGRTADQFRKRTGVVACSLYGTTETGGISVATAASGVDVDGRVGPPMQGVEIMVRTQADADDPTEPTAELENGIGKLYVKSSSLMTGYLDELGNVQLPTVDGWFETGDMARLADDGVVHLRGRYGEMINVSGLKVVPCEVEESLLQLPGVVDVKVYAGEHRAGAQLVKAAIAIENGLTVADIRAYCEQQLVYYKRPQLINIVDALPRTPTGKIIRDQLP